MNRNIKAYAKRFAPLLAMLVFPVLGMMYAAVNRVDGRVWNLVTPLDRAVPFIKWFALPYSVWIVFIYVCLLYFFVKDVRTFYRGVITYTLCALLCYLVYSVFQTTVPRPQLSGSDPFTRLVAYIYNRDQPFNCFPSIHCFSSYMVFRILAGSSFKTRRSLTLVGIGSGLIILSTQFIKQHVVLDLAAAIMLVELALPVVVLAERWFAGELSVSRRSKSTTLSS
ncbi:phosphatase PAP2 family protein [Cohnella rhizosphaerae]|uniref:Inositol phosphorylceramide synthase n=1 Tax=Cohnella rhizosphaerae TaxID=1457232 RepID=A0A9X4QSV0_9BACL|nr:inositol phosphorylceramide synthase [Cohnella rhizosphaerae]MDG0809698.1 inositol phosphorylceramide synthase [Cohnella rhizosphaerae]